MGSGSAFADPLQHWFTLVSVQGFKFRQHPGLVEKRLRGPKKAEIGEPRASRLSLDPVRLLPFWWFRTEVHVNRPVWIDLISRLLRTDHCIVGAFDEGPCTLVIGTNAPEEFSRNIGRDAQQVGFAAVKQVSVPIPMAHRVFGAGAKDR